MPSKNGTVVIINYNAGSPRYGPNLRAYYTAKYLAREGYDVQVFSSAFCHKYAVLPETTGEVTPEIIDGAQYNWIRTQPYKTIPGQIFSFHQFGAKVPSAIRGTVREMKALICSSPPTILSRVSHRIAKEYGARFIFEVRDLWPLTILQMGSATRFNPYVMLLGAREKYAYKHADIVVSALPCAEPYMRGRGLPEGRYRTIENGTEAGQLPEINVDDIPHEIRQVLERKVEFRIGYSGAFDRDNDVMSLIRAGELLKEHRIEIVLIGKGIRREQVVNAASRLPNVYVLPAVRSGQVPWVLERCDALYMGLRDKPINKYGVSLNKSFEYMRAARPIVSAIHAGNDIVSDSGCGISATPENPEAIAEAIVKLAEMPKYERDKMGERGLMYLRQNHAYDVLVNDWIRVIENTTAIS